MIDLTTFPKKRRPSVAKALGISLFLTGWFAVLGIGFAYLPDFQSVSTLSLITVWGLSITIGVAGFWNARRPHWIAVFIVSFSLTTLFLAAAVHLAGPYLSGRLWIVLTAAYLFVWCLPLLNPPLAKAISDEQSSPKTWLGKHQLFVVFFLVIISAVLIGIFSQRPLAAINPAMLFIGTMFSFMAVGGGQYFAYQVRKSWEEQTRRAARNPTVDPETLKLFEDGLSQIEAEDFEGAIEELSKAIQVQPAMLDAWLFRGNAYYSLSDYERALHDWDHVIRNDPEVHVAYYNRSIVRMRLEQKDLALSDMDHAIRLESNKPAYYLRRANIQWFREAYDSALADAAKAIELGAAQAGHNLRALIFEEKMGDLPSAIAEWTRILKIDPKDPWASCSRGILLAATGDRKRAIRDLNKGLKNKEKLSDALREKAEKTLRELKEAPE
jgi:tetratricopeptide (TPR) repeat protein